MAVPRWLRNVLIQGILSGTLWGAPDQQQDFTLKGLAAWLRTISSKVQTQNPEHAQAVTREQLLRVYSELNRLQSLRKEYLHALQYLIDARNDHLSQSAAAVRSKAVEDRSRDVLLELRNLDQALAPLQLDLDLANPAIGAPLRRYEWKQGDQMKQSQMVGTFTKKELKLAQKDAEKNGESLQQAIDLLAGELRDKYRHGN